VLRNKKILIGVTGGIAAYKIPQLVRDFKKSGAEVKVVMTDSATEFVAPLTLSTLTQNEVVVGSFPRLTKNILQASTWHIDLAQWADAMLIAPATANTIAKLAYGIADNSVTTLALAMRGPVMLSPSMDVDMWNHPITQSNISQLQQLGYQILQPAEGELASGLTGAGRLPDLPKIQQSIENLLTDTYRDLQGKKILVTAGPTYEPIDPVRFIGNRSSGKMGFALAAAAVHRGAEVTLVAGKTHLTTPRLVKRIDVATAEQMYNAVMKNRRDKDGIIMAAAVADFTPVKIYNQKIKKDIKDKNQFVIKLKPTKDILGKLGTQKGNTVLVGFAVETENELKNAKMKLSGKNLDAIVLNNPTEDGAGFDVETNIATFIPKKGKVEKLPKMSKYQLAHQILRRISKLIG
jgi:phosphopantothenoylcysteine decarboxylase/phosphopantothenate--cysteine ligase